MKAKESGRLVVYVCHPFADSPGGNIAAVRKICRSLVEEGVLPIGPHLYLPQLVDEETEREVALALCLDLLELCDELRVYGERVSSGMTREIEHAARLGLPVRWKLTEAA